MADEVQAVEAQERRSDIIDAELRAPVPQRAVTLNVGRQDEIEVPASEGLESGEWRVPIVSRGETPAVDPSTQPWQRQDWAAMSEATRAEAAIRRAVLAKAVEKLEDAYKRDIAYTSDWLLLFRRVGDTFEWLALVLTGISSIFAYLAGLLTDRWWAFAAGITGTVGLAIAAIGRYCNAQSKERTQQLNKLLGRFSMPPYPDVVAEYTDGGAGGVGVVSMRRDPGTRGGLHGRLH